MGLFSHIKLKRGLRKADKAYIPIYLIYKATPEGDLTSGQPLYYAGSEKEALTYITRLVQLNHADHYASWCKLHDLVPGFPSESWDAYSESVIANEDPEDHIYAVSKAYFSRNNLAAFLRMLSSVKPAILPSESDEELVAYLSTAGQEGVDLVSAAEEIDPLATARLSKVIDQLMELTGKDYPLKPDHSDSEKDSKENEDGKPKKKHNSKSKSTED